MWDRKDFLLTRLWPIVLIAAISFALQVNTANAASIGGISIRTIERNDDLRAGKGLNYILTEGQEIRDSVELINSKSETVTVFLFASGYHIEDGKIKKVEPTVKTASIPGYWVTFDQSEVVIRGNSAKTIGFTLKVPEDADVGEHSALVITTEKVASSQIKGNLGMRMVTQVAVRLTVRIPGDVIRDLIIEKIGHTIATHPKRTLNFKFNLINKSNITLNPTVDTVMHGFFGKVGEQFGDSTDMIGRNQTVNPNLGWKKRAPYFGRFVAKFTFHVGEYEQINKDLTTTQLPDKTFTARYVFWIIPWVEIIYLLITILILYLLRSAWLYVLITKRLQVKTKIHRVQKGDTLINVATEFGVDPTVITKFNLLRWPYELHVGEDLLIPYGRLSQQEWKAEYANLMSRREFLNGIFSHWFSKSNVHLITQRIKGYIGRNKLLGNTELVLIEKGDTIGDVAKFAKTSIETIIKLNYLKPPYRLQAGQELLIPKKNKPPRRRK